MSRKVGHEGESKASRIVTGCVGALFVALAIAIIVVADRQTRPGSLIAAAVVGLLGVDALLSAVRGRRSMLSRIGPLP